MTREVPRDLGVVVTRKRGYPHTGWMWEDIVGDFESALIAGGARPLGSGRPNGALDGVGRVLGRMPGMLPRLGDDVRVLPLMGTKPRLAFPHGYRGRLVLFVWDCWPSETRRWERIFELLRPSLVCFTARDAAEYWGPRLGGERAVWLPEAIDPHVYRPDRALADRAVDLLEMGRRHEPFHAAAVELFQSMPGRQHVFSRPDGPPLFRTRADLVSGIGATKMLACFPASTTHPEGRARSWEVMTYRYLEAAASKTLIVGQIPRDMVELFGFVPGLQLDAADVASLLADVLERPEDYQGLVDRTHRRLLEIGTWSTRAEQVIDLARTRLGT